MQSGDAQSTGSTKYKLIQRSHDGGQLVRWMQSAEDDSIVVGKPVIRNNAIVGIAVTIPTQTKNGKLLCALQCSGICTVAASFTHVRRSETPYIWLHQPVWYDPTDDVIVTRATGNRDQRWSQEDGFVLIGWSLGFDMVSWGLLVRMHLATAAPPLISV